MSAHERVGFSGRGLMVRVWNCGEVERAGVERERKTQVRERKRRAGAFLAFASIEDEKGRRDTMRCWQKCSINNRKGECKRRFLC